MRKPNEKALIGWQAGIRALSESNVEEGIEMKTTTGEAKNQQMVAPAGRRGFLRRAGATALATAAATAAGAAVAAETESVSRAPTLDARGFIRLEDYVGLRREWEYNQTVLMALCLMTELMSEWHQANGGKISAACPETGGELCELIWKARSNARQVADVVGIQLDHSYIAKRGAEYQVRAAGGAA
jgi:hypothetical protein